VVNGLAMTCTFMYGIVGKAQRQQPAHTVLVVNRRIRDIVVNNLNFNFNGFPLFPLVNLYGFSYV
jgi:hypothetical protein